jgi:hypothetical protein
MNTQAVTIKMLPPRGASQKRSHVNQLRRSCGVTWRLTRWSPARVNLKVRGHPTAYRTAAVAGSAGMERSTSLQVRLTLRNLPYVGELELVRGGSAGKRELWNGMGASRARPDHGGESPRRSSLLGKHDAWDLPC